MAKSKSRDDMLLCRGGEIFSKEYLRNFQIETVDVLKRMDNTRGRFSTLVNLPTGAGKTRIALCFCLDVLNRGARVIWIADRIVLLEQAIGEFARYHSEKEYKYQLIGGQGRKVDKAKGGGSLKGESLSGVREDTNIIFASVATIAGAAEKEYKEFRDWINRSQDNEKKLYIIYDEAHHIGALKVYDFFESLICKPSENVGDDRIHYGVARFGIVGFTATVYRGDKYLDVFLEWFKDGYNHESKELYHIKSEYGDPDLALDESVKWNRIAIVGLKELLNGYKGDPPVLVKPEIIRVSEYENGKPKSMECEMEYLADRISKHYKKWGKTAVIVCDKLQAEKLAEILGEKGVGCFPYISGRVNNSELTRFRDAKTNSKILIAVNMLDEGIDIPDLNTLYLYAPTWSQVILRQRMGRVLRKDADRDKDARVIWQYYPENCPTLSDGEFSKMLQDDFKETPESEKELKNDVEEWKGRKLPIPPAMYLEPLPEDNLPQEYYYSSLHRLNALDLFGWDMISEADSVGYYYDIETFDDTGEEIYVRDVERKGYHQLLRVLQNDWQTVLRYSDCEDFEGYAKMLKVGEDELLNDIKQICFYLSDARKADTSGYKLKKRILVQDEDIKTFCRWFMTGKIEYQPIRELGADGKKAQQADRALLNKCSIDKPQEVEYSEDAKQLETLFNLLKKQKAKPLLKINNTKEYTDLLEYGKYIYPEVQSVKSLLRMGAIDAKRIGAPGAPGKEWAFIGKDAVEGTKREVPHVRRKMKSVFTKSDWLLVAYALVDMPNHIWIEQKDVDEYEAELIAGLKLNNRGDKEQVVKEFLMALGYVKNEDIIRRQCEIFKDNLPRLVQYILYEKAYWKLSEGISFEDKNGKLQLTCQNEKDLQKKYEDFLAGYGVRTDMLTGLSPVEDVIYDCRPYLKVVPYYQGIKPEFLCRMVNDIIQMQKESNTPVKHAIDAFGGSGACTMNGFYKKISPKHFYNDLGIMNTSFYKCLKNENLETEIDGILRKAFSCYDAKKEIIQYFNKFGKYLSIKKAVLEKKKGKGADSATQESIKKVNYAIEILKMTIEKAEEDYAERYDRRVTKYREDLKEGQKSYQAIYLETRLQYVNAEYVKKLGDNNATELCKACRSVERYLHVFMMKASALYLVMIEEIDIEKVQKYGIKEQDLGVLFMLYNTFSNRHFYSDCTIDLISEFANNFRDRLNYGKERFEDVEILQKNALELLKDETYNQEDAVWYLDIPYVETDSTDYVPGWFDVNEFIGNLDKCRGTYIVSSRCNICLPNESKAYYSVKTSLGADISDALIQYGTKERLLSALEKEINVFLFYNSFISAEFADKYEKVIPVLKDDKSAPVVPVHLSEERKAKYVLIPYTKMQEDYFENHKEDKAYRLKKEANTSKISRQYVRRMLAATHFSNIPVEVMITNADLEVDKMPIQKVGKGVYALPTFRTGVDATQYMVEPVVIILEYETYINILLSLLYHDEYKEYMEDEKAKAAAEYFRNKYYTDYMEK